MNEKEIVKKIAYEHLDDLSKLLHRPLRVYAIEFPIEIEKQRHYADLLIEVEKNKNSLNNILLIFEFKKNKIKYGPIDQLEFYLNHIPKKLYRKKATGFLAAPDFSDHEIQQLKERNLHGIQFDLYGNIKLVA